MKHPIPCRCAFFCFLMVLIGCKPSVPSEIIQPGDLEDILYDYHVADAIPYAKGDYQDLTYWRQVYRDAVLRKHGVTEAELDSALVYYYRHTELLLDVYERLAKRLGNDAIALGATANELSQFEGLSSQGDTTTVWSNAQSLALMPVAPFNSFSFEVKADTAYHEGDKMILSFDNQFIYQEGTRDGMALMAVTFKNDSTASQVVRVTGDNHYTMQVVDVERVGVKHIRGFLYLGKGYNTSNNSQTLKLMCVTNMKLVRMHMPPPDDKEGMEDSIPKVRQPLDIGGGNPLPDVPKHPQVESEEPPKTLDVDPNANGPRRVFELPAQKRQAP